MNPLRSTSTSRGTSTHRGSSTHRGTSTHRATSTRRGSSTHRGSSTSREESISRGASASRSASTSRSAHRQSMAAETREKRINEMAAKYTHIGSWENRDRFLEKKDLDEIGDNREFFIDVRERILAKRFSQTSAASTEPSNHQPSLSYSSTGTFEPRPARQRARTQHPSPAQNQAESAFTQVAKALETTYQDATNALNDFYKFWGRM